jgi:hypothetical protein
MLLLILSAQAAVTLPALDFDLARQPAAKPGCDAGSSAAGGDIVVCAKRHAATDIPIKALPVEELLPKAEFKLFGQVRGKISGERGNVGPIPTNRAMVTLSVPF